jgi:hypothetical protein
MRVVVVDLDANVPSVQAPGPCFADHYNCAGVRVGTPEFDVEIVAWPLTPSRIPSRVALPGDACGGVPGSRL